MGYTDAGMPIPDPRDPKEFAQRMSHYADGITVFVVLQSVAIVAALANKDLARNSLPQKVVAWPLVSAVAIVYFAAVMACHAAEDELLGFPDNKSLVGKWTRRVRLGRMIMIAGSIFYVIVTYAMFGGKP